MGFFLYCIHSHMLLFSEMIDPSGQKSRQISVSSVDVLGGGRILLQSDKEGIYMNVTRLKIHTGGRVDATKLHLTANYVEVAQSGLLDLSNKANYFSCLLSFVLLKQKRVDLSSNSAASFFAFDFFSILN